MSFWESFFNVLFDVGTEVYNAGNKMLEEEYLELVKKYKRCQADESFDSAYDSARFLAEATPRMAALRSAIQERQ